MSMFYKNIFIIVIFLVYFFVEVLIIAERSLKIMVPKFS